MSVMTAKEAYEAIQPLSKEREVYAGYENNEEWIFAISYSVPPKRPMPGDYSSYAVVSKIDGKIERRGGWEWEKNLLKYPLTKRGYKAIDIHTLTRFNAHEEERFTEFSNADAVA